jgi:hypothetical protein
MFTIQETRKSPSKSIDFHDPVQNFHFKKKMEKTELFEQVIQLKSEKALLKLDITRFQ